MTTPAQPAPVTPPPEWAVRAAREIVSLVYTGGTGEIYAKEFAAIIQHYAPPPAPSCVEGEYDENWPVLQRLQWRARWTSNPKVAKDCRDAIAALSRQPAPNLGKMREIINAVMNKADDDEAASEGLWADRPERILKALTPYLTAPAPSGTERKTP